MDLSKFKKKIQAWIKEFEEKIFSPSKYVDSVRKEFLHKTGESVMVDITALVESDMSSLYNEMFSRMTHEEISKTCVVHARNSLKTQTSSELIIFHKG